MRHQTGTAALTVVLPDKAWTTRRLVRIETRKRDVNERR